MTTTINEAPVETTKPTERESCVECDINGKIEEMIQAVHERPEFLRVDTLLRDAQGELSGEETQTLQSAVRAAVSSSFSQMDDEIQLNVLLRITELLEENQNRFTNIARLTRPGVGLSNEQSGEISQAISELNKRYNMLNILSQVLFDDCQNKNRAQT